MVNVTIKTSYHFYLFHVPTKTLIENLTWTQLNALCRTFNNEEELSFNVWIAEINKWVKLEDMFKEILKRSDGLFKNPPTPLKGMDDQTYTHQLMRAPEELRKHKRFNVKLPITVDIMGSLINIFTSDISYGGMRFQNPIPTKGVISHCFAYHHVNDDHFIEFKVAPIYESGSTNAFHRLRLVSCSDLSLWQQLLDKAKSATDK